MSVPWSVTLTSVPKSEDCVIETSDGRKFTVQGVAIFADGGEGNLFSYWWNSPGKAASGFVRSLGEAIRREDQFAQQFYRAILRGLAMATCGKDRKVVSADDLLRRWDAEDTYKSVQVDGKKFN